MIVQIVLLIIGFLILIKGADIFVDGASSVAQNFKVSKVLIGLTIVAFGTSAPEFAISIKSMINGSGDIVLGNVIGSNIINSLLIIGISSIIYPLVITKDTVKKELPIALLISTLLVILFSDNLLSGGANVLTRGDALAIILFFLVFLYYLASVMKNKNKINENDGEDPKYKMSKSWILTILGIVGIVLGSELAVNSAIEIAEILNISERVISLTIIALGTSLPELCTSIVAAVKHEQGIVMGNIIGSNIFNICIVLGIPVSIFGNISPGSFSNLDIFMLLFSSIILLAFSKNDYKVSRVEGILMVLLFCIYYSFIIINF